MSFAITNGLSKVVPKILSDRPKSKSDLDFFGSPKFWNTINTSNSFITSGARGMERSSFLTPAPMGYFRILHADLGGGRPPAICQTTGQILGPKTIFDSSGLEVSEYTYFFI